jgi:hypothetical protein
MAQTKHSTVSIILNKKQPLIVSARARNVFKKKTWNLWWELQYGSLAQSFHR